MAASEGVDEAAAVPLSENMQCAALVQVHQVHQVLHLIQRTGVGLATHRIHTWW